MALQNFVVEIGYHAPLVALAAVAGRRGLTFLDSSMAVPNLGRWSFLAFEPFGTFEVEGGCARWNGETLPQPPLEALRGLLERYRSIHVKDGPPLQSGAIGWLAYEAGHLFEGALSPLSDASTRQISLRFYNGVIAFDQLNARSYVCVGAHPGEGALAVEQRARRFAQEVDTVLRAASSQPAGTNSSRPPNWTSNFSRAAYEAAVARVVEYIAAGDIFQANISQRFTCPIAGPICPIDLYRRLRHCNPAPFSALIVEDDGSFIASSSPERFFEVRGKAVQARPIKGTRRRSEQPALDRLAAEELLASEKDRAENVMIVDLLRNDLSRACDPHTVTVETLCGLETYASVHHLVSVVTGRLSEGLDGLDLLAASFPGGSITGAPKIRAMQIIHEIEAAPRGIYCGSIGYLDFNGDIDLNIAIRTMCVNDSAVSFNAGGGVTLLSQPADEYEETLTKAARLFAALAEA